MKEDVLKIGVFINDQLNPFIGGGYSYNHRLLKALQTYNFSNEIQFKFVRISNPNSPLKEFQNEDLITLNPPISRKYKIYSAAEKFLRLIPQFNRIKNKLEGRIKSLEVESFRKQLVDAKVHLLYYLTPNIVINNYPFVINNWDIGHRTLFPFPEVAMNRTYEKRETFYRNKLNKAFLIFVESEQGKNELMHYYQINEEKIKVFPMFPGEVIFQNISPDRMESILKEHSLKKQQYFFYPAQFWAHKNHYNLIKAFELLHKKNPNLKLVFTGADKGNLKYINQFIYSKGLAESVNYLGFVSNETLFTLYVNTISLIMPTFLGPTNMPLLEADSLGIKVLCSNLPGHMELLGNRAIYFSPHSFESIFQAMEKAIATKEEKKHGTEYPLSIDLLERYFTELLPLRFTFGFNFDQY